MLDKIVEKLRGTRLEKPNPHIILFEGRILTVGSGKSVWTNKRNASLALSHYLHNELSYNEMKELRKMCDGKSIGEFLEEKGIVEFKMFEG